MRGMFGFRQRRRIYIYKSLYLFSLIKVFSVSAFDSVCIGNVK